MIKIYVLKSNFLHIWDLLNRPQLFYEVTSNPSFYRIEITLDQLKIIKENNIWFSQSGIT